MTSTSDAIELTVNGESVTLDIAATTPLLSALRHDLSLCGVRTGCGIGACGACTVLVDGRPTRSCDTPLSEVAGRRVVTPEGLGTPDAPHPIQRAFLERQAAQCGYCVNGIVMTVAGLAESGAGEEQLAEALDDHLCRCGTHVRILAAAREALGLDAPSRSADGDSGPTGQTPGPVAPGELPPAIAAHPRIEQWVELAPDGRVAVNAGKVELGQGIRTAFAQIVAAQLGIHPRDIEVRSVRTDRSPDQWFTAGSLSIEDGGTALARAGAAFGRLVRSRAAQRFGVDVREVELVDGCAVAGQQRASFAELAAERPLTGTIEPTDTPRWGPPVGEPQPREDLRRKLTGAPAYLQDLTLPGMLHARAALPPSASAELVEADLEPARALPGIVEVLRDGRLVLVIAERDDQAIRAVSRLARDLRWEEHPLDVPADVHEHLRRQPAEPFPVREDDVDSVLARAQVHRATYTTPYQAHGPMGPSAAAAHLDDGHLTVWAHAQGAYPLKRELEVLLGIGSDRITVEHVDGPGAYGMNGADDAAALAAMAARAVPGRPVRFQFSIQDEFSWEPYGPAMAMDLEAGLDADGRIVGWRYHGVTDTHMTRPQGAGDRLFAAWLREDAVPPAWPGAAEGGVRNGAPFYDIPVLSVVADHVRGPLRTAALRCLGAYANVFATESFVDELAERAGQDPVAFRLAHLRDERARHVLELAAERAGWEPHVGPSGRGMGVAVAHYKDSKAYVAQVAEVDVDAGSGAIRVRRITVVADAGLVINPDGIRNQLEGGTLQGLSRAMFERLTVGASGVRERDWTSYPVLRFSHVPELDVLLVHRPDLPPLGAGESATPPVPAAVANAIDDAIGVRLRDLPLDAAQIERRLLEMDETEGARVRL